MSVRISDATAPAIDPLPNPVTNSVTDSVTHSVIDSVIDSVIGIDLGGTAIKLGRFDRQGHCLQSLTVPTPQPAQPEPTLSAIQTAIAQLDPENRALAIGIGTPGPADAQGRIARLAINLPGWVNVPVADWLEARFHKPIGVENDANCAAVGEGWLGAGRQFPNLILLTLGTGVGGGILINGQLYRGYNGSAGELGLITLDPSGPTCKSGNRGSLEQHLSISAIVRATGQTPEMLGQRAQAGDADAIAFWQTYGQTLGIGLTSLIYVLSPDAIVIGGGISASSPFFFPAAWAEIQQRVKPTSRENLQLLQATLGNQAGMVGAAKIAWQRANSSQ
jgi:glucokinase